MARERTARSSSALEPQRRVEALHEVDVAGACVAHPVHAEQAVGSRAVAAQELLNERRQRLGARVRSLPSKQRRSRRRKTMSP